MPTRKTNGESGAKISRNQGKHVFIKKHGLRFNLNTPTDFNQKFVAIKEEVGAKNMHCCSSGCMRPGIGV